MKTQFRICLPALVLTALLSILCPAEIRADVIFEPENDFYTAHSEECLYHTRSYRTVSEQAFYDAPGASGSGTLASGVSVPISWLYRDGDGRDWGFFEQSTGDAGWIPMAEMALLYDSTEFIADHSADLNLEQPQTVPSGNSVVFWSYPESGTTAGSIDALESDLELSPLYTDAEGRTWGYFGYYMGYRDSWICISAPSDPDIPSGETPEQKYYTAPAELSELSGIEENVSLPPLKAHSVGASGAGGVSWLVIAAAVAAVAAVTLLLLKMFWHKKR